MIYGAWPLPYTSIYKQGGPDYPQFYSEALPFISNLTYIEIKVDYNISKEVHSQIHVEARRTSVLTNTISL